MPLADTGRAIGAVTQLLHDRLLSRLGATVADVTIGRPEPPVAAPTNPRVNLFLYEIQLDGHLKNLSLDEGQPAPLWLVLRYLITAFDRDGESDSIQAHEILGESIRALHGLNFLTLAGLTPATIAALGDNPDMMKLTFEETTSDLLSRIMQGSEERYRCSVAFQVRPVMVATGEPPSYSLLVGVDYNAGVIIGEDGIQIPVIPSLGPIMTELSPPSFEPGSTLTIRGTDLHLSGLSVNIGPAEVPVTAQRPDELRCQVNGAILGGTVVSAGNHGISVSQTLPSGRRRSSNLLLGALRPVLSTAVPNGLTRVNPADPASGVFGNIDLTGVLLGREQDDVFVALYRDGRTVRMFDTFVPTPPPPPPPPVVPQTRMRVPIPREAAAPPGPYRVILRVNGQQARNSPEVMLVVP